MRRILMISPHFPPDSSAGAHRVRLLAPHLPEFGWEPTVLTVSPESYESILDPKLAALVPSSLRVERTQAWSARWTRLAGIGDLGIRAFTSLRRAAESLLSREKFDAVFVTIYPTYPAMLGPILKRRFGVPFVLDYQDPWVGSWGATVGGGVGGRPDIKSQLTRRVALTLEPIAVRAADAITAVSTATYEEVLARVPVSPVVATLPVGFDAADFSALNGSSLPGFDPSDGAFHMSYVGTLLPHGLDVLDAFFGAARLLRDRAPSLYRKLRLHFVGTSNQFGASQPARASEAAERHGVADIVHEHPGRIPYLQALSVLKQSAAILMLGSSEAHYTASKMFPALLAERPVLAIYHEASSVVSMLRAFGRAPSVRVVPFSNLPSEAEIAAQLEAMLVVRDYDRAAVDLSSLHAYSSRGLAGTLSAVLDRVCRT